MARAKPVVSRTFAPIHFEDLDPHRFEDLVRELIYDFRDWQSIEATGRSGDDAGFAEAECNVFQIAAISGHKDLREVQLYVDAYNRKKAAGEAMGKLIAAQNANVVCLNGKDS
jgi:hypothetical protein